MIPRPSGKPNMGYGRLARETPASDEQRRGDHRDRRTAPDGSSVLATVPFPSAIAMQDADRGARPSATGS